LAGILIGALRGVPAEGVAENRRLEARGRLSPYSCKSQLLRTSSQYQF